MDRNSVMALMAAIATLTYEPAEARAPDATAHVEEAEEETLALDPYGARIVEIAESRTKVTITGDLDGLRILVTDSQGNLVFPKWTFEVEENKVVITFSGHVGEVFDEEIFLGFIDYRGAARKVSLNWL